MPRGRRPYRTAIAAAAALATAAAAGCGADSGSSAESDDATRTVEGVNGPVEIPEEPERIAVLWRPTLAAVTQLGYEATAALGEPGAEDSGLAPFLPQDAGAEAITIVSNSPAEDDINVQELANTEPDLILGVSTQLGTQADLLDQLEGIAPTVLLEWTGTESWRGHLTEVAEVLDAAGAAEEAVADYEAAVEEARAEITEAAGEPADTEASLVRLQDESEIRLETPESFPGQVIDDLGFSRPDSQITPDADSDFISESYENLDQADGDLLFVFASGGYEEAPETFDGGVWENLDVVAAGEVYAVDYDYWGASNYYGAHRIITDVTAALTGEMDPAV